MIKSELFVKLEKYQSWKLELCQSVDGYYQLTLTKMNVDCQNKTVTEIWADTIDELEKRFFEFDGNQ